MKTFSPFVSFLLPILSLLSVLEARAAGGVPVRGVHVDFRTEVMTPSAMKEMAADLAGMGINTIVMEWEAAFPYDRHATISNRLAWTPEEVRDLVAFCGTLGIDVIPLQHCFGHVEYILRHDRYSRLRERFRSEISQICPLKPEAEELFREIFAEVAALHDSEYFHIGGDETYLLGLCPECSAFVEEHGKSKLFVDYISKMCRIVTELGKKPVLWADIITMYPEAVNELPADAVLVDWNYGWDVRRFGDIDKVYASGLEIWGAPAIRSSPDSYYLTDWAKHFRNQAEFIPYARSAGYKGIIMTSWSTSGLYGVLFEPGDEVVAIDPIRTVYPMSGFRIALAMYGEALRSDGPVDPEGFVLRYGAERFGFSAGEAAVLWRVLAAPQRQVRYGIESGTRAPVAEVLAATRAVRDELYTLVPRRNRREIDHLRLMMDLRVQYLEYKVIEAEFNSPGFSRAGAAALLARLEGEVISKNDELARRFTELNSGYIKEAELPYLNSVRERQMTETLNALRAITR